MAALAREAARLREEPQEPVVAGDTHCFQMLSMLLSLSGSTVGRRHLSGQRRLVSDLLCLLHAGSARCQRQVVSLLRRVLPEVTPAALAELQGRRCRLPGQPQSPPADTAAGDGGETDPETAGQDQQPDDR